MLLGEAGGSRRTVALVVALMALACALVLPALASAESFEVNSSGDGKDVLSGNGLCLTVSEECTLRAAIEESNTLEGEDTIGFVESVFDGGPNGVISLGSTLPTIEGIVSIEGECILADDFIRPCVGVDGPSATKPALIVKNTEAVRIVGLAITGAETAIEVIGTPRFKALSDWLGVKLDGSPGSNGTGILIDPGSNNSQIGNEGETNVFAYNIADGLDIHGASGVKVMGGYFGVGPDGVSPAPNAKDIEVTAYGGSEAVGATIGTQVSATATGTPACDGGCNVISGSQSSGIDLEGDGGEEAPATATAIVGNYIGLGASGTVPVPNASVGIHVGQAVRTVIGGPRNSEINRLSGSSMGIDAGPGAADLVIRGNSIGVDPNGLAPLAPPDKGIVLDSEGLPGPASEAVVAGNKIRMRGGVGIDLKGLGGWIVDNEISGADTGISTYDPTEEHGNLIEGNLIKDSTINGILVESSFNEIFGNQVLSSSSAGIHLEGAHSLFGFGVGGNLVGGNAKAEENLVAGSGGAAIEISNLANTSNEVARNRGFANDGLFIDLVRAVPTEKGPNKGIEPPTFFAATNSEAIGFAAEPGAQLRIFRKASPEAGEIESFLGEVIADKDGEWNVEYDAPIPAGTILAATQTSEGGTSELVTAVTPADPAADRPAAVRIADRTPPQTRIVKTPRKRSHSTTVRFKFDSDEAGSTFQCKLDGRKYRACKSPKKYRNLKPGKHVFEVRAIDLAGNVDGSAAKRNFQILP